MLVTTAIMWKLNNSQRNPYENYHASLFPQLLNIPCRMCFCFWPMLTGDISSSSSPLFVCSCLLCGLYKGWNSIFVIKIRNFKNFSTNSRIFPQIQKIFNKFKNFSNKFHPLPTHILKKFLSHLISYDAKRHENEIKLCILLSYNLGRNNNTCCTQKNTFRHGKTKLILDFILQQLSKFQPFFMA